MSGQIHDLAIIGGGITGCSIARDAAGRGLSVFLCDQADLAGAGSSASMKLVDGGLHHVDQLALGSLREGLKEREVLLRSAPHLVRPLRLLLPYRNRTVHKTMLRAAMFAYDHLAGRRAFPPTRMLDRSDGAIGEVLRDEFAGAAEYSDCRVDDARLVVANAMDARGRGASINPRLRCVIAERDGRAWRLSLEASDSDRRFVVRARSLVNATGPWTVDVLNHVIDASRSVRVRLVKSTHVVVRRLFGHDRAYALRATDRRIVFVIPHGDHTLIGTADEDFHGDPGSVAADNVEIAYLLSTVGAYFRQLVLEDQIAWSWAGVRAIRDDGSAKPRPSDGDGIIEEDGGEGRAPLISVYGGRITTSRRLAERVVDQIGKTLPVGKAWTSQATLPGGGFEVDGMTSLVGALKAAYPFVDDPWARRLIGSYGTLAQSILSGARSPGDLGRTFGADLTEAEARYLVREEWARTAEDILWRRSKLGAHFSAAEAAALEDWLAEQGLGALSATIAGAR